MRAKRTAGVKVLWCKCAWIERMCCGWSRESKSGGSERRDQEDQAGG